MNTTESTATAINDLLHPAPAPKTATVTVTLPVDVLQKLNGIAYANATQRTGISRGAVTTALLSSAITDLYIAMCDQNGYGSMDRCVRDAQMYRTPANASNKRTVSCVHCGQYNDPNDLYCTSCNRAHSTYEQRCTECGASTIGSTSSTRCAQCDNVARCRVCNACGAVNAVNRWACVNCDDSLPAPIYRETVPVLTVD